MATLDDLEAAVQMLQPTLVHLRRLREDLAALERSLEAARPEVSAIVSAILNWGTPPPRLTTFQATVNAVYTKLETRITRARSGNYTPPAQE
jgi:predicted transcriptional regulator